VREAYLATVAEQDSEHRPPATFTQAWRAHLAGLLEQGSPDLPGWGPITLTGPDTDLAFSLLGAPIAETVFEPRVGGNIVDRAADGSECRWARILAFDPPDRVVFSWDISPRWTIETDQAQTSEVEVRFYAESPTRTRVELEHRHIDRHGPGWEAVTDGVDGPEGWPLYLDRYAALLKGGR